jgi:hypothetical protein
MRRIAEKPDLINTIAVKVWTEAGISSSLGSTNLVFRINPQESCQKKGILTLSVEFGNTISTERVENVL